jgi:ribosomal protein L40E
LKVILPSKERSEQNNNKVVCSKCGYISPFFGAVTCIKCCDHYVVKKRSLVHFYDPMPCGGKKSEKRSGTLITVKRYLLMWSCDR